MREIPINDTRRSWLVPRPRLLGCTILFVMKDVLERSSLDVTVVLERERVCCYLAGQRPV